MLKGWKPHTRDAPASPPRAPARRGLYNPLPRPALAGLDHNVSVFRFHPEDSLAGGPPARWFVISLFGHRPQRVASASLISQARARADAPESCAAHVSKTSPHTALAHTRTLDRHTQTVVSATASCGTAAASWHDSALTYTL